MLRAEGLRLSRRELLIGAAAISLSPSCSFEPGHTGVIAAMEGKPRLEPSRLEGMLAALEATPVLLYRKVAHDLRLLTAANQRPQGVPEWVHPGSFPLQISHDGSHTSLAVMEMQTTGNKQDAYLLMLPNLPPRKHYPIETVKAGIHLGQPKELLEQGTLAQAFYLAKEYLSLVMTMGVGEELFGLSSELGFRVTDQHGKDINNPKDQARVGVSILGEQLSNKSSQMWQVMDTLPIFMVGYLIPYLIQQGIMKNSTIGLQEFMLASNKANGDPQLAQSLTDIIKAWIDADTLLPPRGTTLKALSPPLAQATYDLQVQFRSINPNRSK